ncbi:hydrolase [Bradyrhizobium sp. 197]|uniref:GDSL-type esterase/lipase family protein n=1 Tax=Bradyrhizobium sp. 197 TaxID=2782663 RepID=UPI001FF946BF|nr:GDSL-type esterase/lipase family protein [Bradyrhizobium sp. 197]MCK1480830.1 hydrolase [Bradyrhizobium sp. 197]
MEKTPDAYPPDCRLFRIMAFGDSNTFGTGSVAVPPSLRLAPEDRWPRVMQSCLISAEVMEEGLPGRTTDLEDLGEPVQGGVTYSGLQHLPTALASHQPLDLVILMLGTNDAKTRFERDAHDIAAGMRRLVSTVKSFQSIVGYTAPSVLVISPPAIASSVVNGRLGEMFACGSQLTAALPDLYRAIAWAEPRSACCCRSRFRINPLPWGSAALPSGSSGTPITT